GWRALIKVTQGLAGGRLFVAVIVYEWVLPDVERARLDLCLDIHGHFGNVRRHKTAWLRRLNHAVFGVIVELDWLPGAGHNGFHAIDVMRAPDEAVRVQN